jgi:hypothetical protein
MQQCQAVLFSGHRVRGGQPAATQASTSALRHRTRRHSRTGRGPNRPACCILNIDVRPTDNIRASSTTSTNSLSPASIIVNSLSLASKCLRNQPVVRRLFCNVPGVFPVFFSGVVVSWFISVSVIFVALPWIFFITAARIREDRHPPHWRDAPRTAASTLASHRKSPMRRGRGRARPLR